jgi:hypothetical protein
MSRLPVVLVVAALAAIAVVTLWPTANDPVEWTPDGLYYQAKLLEYRGVPHDEAMDRAFEGPLSAELRARDPHQTGDAAWVRYSEPFYERRVAVPLAGAALYPVAGDRSLLLISLAGYVAAVLALFGLLLLRFRLAVAAAVAGVAAFLPPLVDHSSYPLTDSWGLTFEIAAFAAALLTLDRGRRWLALWVPVILVLAFTRDSTWIPVLSAGIVALRFRSGRAAALFGSGVAASLPALLLFSVPVRPLLALLVNESTIPTDRSWSFILGEYPGSLVQLVRANGGFLRDGEWLTTLYLVGGVIVLFALALRTWSRRDVATTLFTGASAVALLYVLAAPLFSAFRLELVFLPMAAFGLALAGERVLARFAGRAVEHQAPEPLTIRSAAP